jgi:hypothetical protein
MLSNDCPAPVNGLYVSGKRVTAVPGAGFPSTETILPITVSELLPEAIRDGEEHPKSAAPIMTNAKSGLCTGLYF